MFHVNIHNKHLEKLFPWWVLFCSKDGRLLLFPRGVSNPTCENFWRWKPRFVPFLGFFKAHEKSWCTDVASSMKISQYGNLIEVDCNSSLDRLGHLVRCGKECCMVSPSPGPGVGGSVFQKDCWLQLIFLGRFGYRPVLLIYSSIQFEPRVPLSFFWGRRYFFQLEALATKAVYTYIYIDIDTYIINYVCIHIYIFIYLHIHSCRAGAAITVFGELSIFAPFSLNNLPRNFSETQILAKVKTCEQEPCFSVIHY